MKPTIAVLYGDVGAAALIDALKAWRAQYAPGAAYDAIFAEYVNCTKSETSIYPGGRATIHIHVQGRRKATSDHYYYEATLTGGDLKLERITDEQAKADQA